MSSPHSTASSTLTRSRGAILLLTTCAAAYGLYYIQRSHASIELDHPTNSGLHRSNAVHRRHRRPSITHTSGDSSTPSDPLPHDDDANIVARPLVDGETVVDQDEFELPGRAPTADVERNGQNVVQLLFRVSEDATRRNAYVHRGCGCNSCGVVPIRGIRYRCANCADFDLCEGCEAQGLHTKTHIFYKVRIPAPSFGPRQIQPVWYCGDPDRNARILSKEMIAKFSRETGFERPELEAYWEQWTFMANTEWREDPDDISLAMDRRTFERCLVPTSGYRNTTPSLIFDRMFAFYDTNKDDLIGFSEFLHGLAYRKKKDKWTKIFQGYDIDEDGYVDRKDFLRMFRSFYVLYRQMHKDMQEGLDDQQMMSTEAHALVNSRNPLSSAFGPDGRYPTAASTRRGEGKSMLNDELVDGKGVLRESSNDTGNREDVLRHSLTSRLSNGSHGSFSINRGPRGYWYALTNPPPNIAAFGQLVENMADDRADEASRTNEHLGGGSDEDEEDDDDDEIWIRRQREYNVTQADADSVGGFDLEDVPSDMRSFVIKHAQQRQEAENAIHERWQRRQFYTDEEEGATAPADWNDEEDIFVQSGLAGESSNSKQRPSLHSRSSSKVRFAEDMDDFDTRSNPSTSSRSVPERWGGIDIPDAEKDAGKEILFQVTQQSYNELLDPLFKEQEDLAIKAAATKEDRDKYRHLFTRENFATWASIRRSTKEVKDPFTPNRTIGVTRTEPKTARPRWHSNGDILEVDLEDVREHSLENLLGVTGYTVEEPDENGDVDEATNDIPDSAPSPPRLDTRAVSQLVPAENTVVEDYNDLSEGAPLDAPERRSPSNSSQSSTYRDPTLPQFRPDSGATISLTTSLPSNGTRQNEEVEQEEETESIANTSRSASHEPHAESQASNSTKSEKKEEIPCKEAMYKLWELDQVVKDAEERGGFGKLNYTEFEKAVKGQIKEGRGNSMDYLGSWIEFCIP